MYNHTIKGRPAEQCYNWILEQMSKHYVVPSFSSRNQSNAQTYTMKYDQANDNYSITLTDTNNTLAKPWDQWHCLNKQRIGLRNTDCPGLCAPETPHRKEVLN